MQVGEYGEPGLLLFWNKIKQFVLDKEEQTQWSGDSQSGVQTLLTTTLSELSEQNAIKVFDFGWPTEEEYWEQSEIGASVASSPSASTGDSTCAASAEATEPSESGDVLDPRDRRDGIIL